MFGTIRKHQTWLWAIIITLTIISFVIFFSPYSKLNESRGPANYGSIFGKKITPEEYNQTLREVYLRYFFVTGNWPDGEEAKRRGFEPMRETYTRLFLIRKQEDLGIQVDPGVVAQVGRNLIRQFERFQIKSPEQFFNQVLTPQKLDVADFERFVRHELGVQELSSTLGLSGKLITPEEAKAVFVREHEEMMTEAVFFSVSNYLAQITVSPEEVSEFYSNRLANYRIPERAQVSYVKFDATNFIAEADAELAKFTNINQRIDQVYQQRGTNFYADLKPEEAKEKIRLEMIKELRLISARKKATEFASHVYDVEPMRPENLATLASSNGLTAQVSPPFDRDTGPKELNVGPNFGRLAFELNPTNECFAGPIVGEEAVYVIAYNKRLPSELPSLDQVREKVSEDVKFSKALTMARTAGMQFSQSVSNGMAQGKTFSAIAAEAKVPLVELPPVSLSTRTLPEVEKRIQLNQLQQIAFGTPPGTVSPYVPTLEGGIIVYVKARKVPDEAKLKAELPAFVNNLRQSRQNQAFEEWLRKEGERGLRDTPIMQQQRPPPSVGANTAKS
jgi:hypothetical protein